MNLNFETKGLGYPILCLHGHPGTGRSMSVFTDFLCDRAQTIAPDLRGYGRSRPSGRFEMSDHLIDLTALLDRLKIDRCLLLGWSLGGILALELALQYPQRFSHPPISWQDLLFTGVAGTINYFLPGWTWNIKVFGKRSLFRYLVCQQTPLAYRYLSAYGVSAYLQTSNAAQKALSTALRSGYDRLEDLSQIDIPSLVLAGSEDRHITAKSSHETALHLTQCQWQCYSDTAHLFPWEIPDRVKKDIDLWLQNNPQVLS
jgi:pimeloyl-ACP methyl ester carboxylesterase